MTNKMLHTEQVEITKQLASTRSDKLTLTNRTDLLYQQYRFEKGSKQTRKKIDKDDLLRKRLSYIHFIY